MTSWLRIYASDGSEDGRVNLDQVVALTVGGSGTAWYPTADRVVGGSVRLSSGTYISKAAAVVVIDDLLLNGS